VNVVLQLNRMKNNTQNVMLVTFSLVAVLTIEPLLAVTLLQ